MTTIIDFVTQQLTWLDVFARISPLGWGLLVAVLVIMFLIYIILSQSAAFCHADEEREVWREHDKIRFDALERGMNAEIRKLRLALSTAQFTIAQLKGFADQATKSHLVETAELKKQIANSGIANSPEQKAEGIAEGNREQGVARRRSK
jgi:hypothetical protein